MSTTSILLIENDALFPDTICQSLPSLSKQIKIIRKLANDIIAIVVSALYTSFFSKTSQTERMAANAKKAIENTRIVITIFRIEVKNIIILHSITTIHHICVMPDLPVVNRNNNHYIGNSKDRKRENGFI